MQKTITFIGLNFYPEDSAIGLYSTQWAEYLSQSGFKVNIVTAFPYYPQWEIASEYQNKKSFLKETYKGMTLYRYKQYTPKQPTFLKRVWHIVDFTFGSFRNLRKIKNCDLVISVIPFTSSAFLGNWHSRKHKAKHWVHIQDFEFDAAFQSGLVQQKSTKKSLPHRLLSALERSILDRADCVSTISHTMVAKLKQKTKSDTYLLPNWIDATAIDPQTSTPHPYFSGEKFTLLYSGNIGDKQDWAFFEALIAKMDWSKYQMVLVGDGARRKDVAAMIKPYPEITWHPPVPYETLSDLLCSADAHFLFQKTEVRDSVMPSKILGMMASAKPSVVTGHPQSEVRTSMNVSKGGYYISENDISATLKAFETLYENTEKATQMGKQARAYVVEQFSKEVILKKATAALLEL